MSASSSPAIGRRPQANAALQLLVVAGIAWIAALSTYMLVQLPLAPLLVTAVLVGALVGMASAGRWTLNAAGGVLGSAIALAFAWPRFISGLSGVVLYLALVGAAAAGVTWVLQKALHRWPRERLFAWVLVVFVIVALWSTTFTISQWPTDATGTTLAQDMAVRPELNQIKTDHDLYLRLFYDVQDGQPYYESVIRDFRANATDHRLPDAVSSYRLPTIFFLWRLLPRRSELLIPAFLVFASVAVLASFAIGSQMSRPGVAALGATITAAAFLRVATDSYVTFVEGWAMAPVLAGVALFIWYRRRRIRWVLWCSVALVFTGAAMRELFAYVLALGAATALIERHESRWREMLPWVAGLAAFAALYAVHAMEVAGRVSGGGGYGYWLHGGPMHFMASVEFLNRFFGAGMIVLPLLVMLGVYGGVSYWNSDARLSALMVSATVVPLALFLLFGSEAGARSGYWGMIAVPLALALVPVGVWQSLRSAGLAGPSRFKWSQTGTGVPAQPSCPETTEGPSLG